LRLGRVLGVAFGLGAIAGGCTSDLRLALEGKLCDAAQRCATGYECYVPENLCYARGQLPNHEGGFGGGIAGGSGGVDSVGGHAGYVSAGTGGGAGLGGTGSPGGSGGFGGAGGGGGAVDPNNPDGGFILPDGGCLTTTVYFDEDGDGVGDASESQTACPSIEWVVVGGDCRDDQPLVFPGQTQHFAVGYPSPVAGGQGVSFDYDCVNGEQPDPQNATNAAVPTCTTLLGLDCTGSGFQAASPPRSGVGIEPRCGSNVRTRCELEMLLGNCNAVPDTLDESEAFRCK
jgi:hypothetical protein